MNSRSGDVRVGDEVSALPHEVSGSSLGSLCERLVEPPGALLQPIQQPSRPDEFGGENRQRENDGQPSRPWQRKHEDAEPEQRESHHDSHHPLGLSQRVHDTPILFATIFNGRGPSL